MRSHRFQVSCPCPCPCGFPDLCLGLYLDLCHCRRGCPSYCVPCSCSCPVCKRDKRRIKRENTTRWCFYLLLCLSLLRLRSRLLRSRLRCGERERLLDRPILKRKVLEEWCKKKDKFQPKNSRHSPGGISIKSGVRQFFLERNHKNTERT